jgi:hypothetical protein
MTRPYAISTTGSLPGHDFFLNAVSPSVPAALMERFAQRFGLTAANVTGVASASCDRRSDPKESCLPARFLSAIAHIAAVCTKRGQDELMLAAAEPCRKSLARMGPAELSIFMYLNEREAFQAARSQVQADRSSESFEYWPARYEPCCMLNKRGLDKLAGLLHGHFGKQASFGWSMDHASGALVVDRSAPEPGMFSRETLKLSRGTGRLSVTAAPELAPRYRALVGQALFDSEEYFGPYPEVSLRPLILDPVEALSAEGVEGVESVHLESVYLDSLASVDETHRLTGFTRRHMRRELRRALRGGQRRIRRAEFLVKTDNRARATRLKITTSGVLSYDRRTSERSVRNFLEQRGFARFAKPRGDGEAMSE